MLAALGFTLSIDDTVPASSDASFAAPGNEGPRHHDEEEGLTEEEDFSSHCTGSLKILVPTKKEDEFKEWLESMMPINRVQPGFIEREVIHLNSKSSDGQTEWVVILRYKDAASFNGWLLSDDRAEALRRLDLLIGEANVNKGFRLPGSDIINTDHQSLVLISPGPPPPPRKVRPPPKWKLWLLLSNIVYLDLIAEFPLGMVARFTKEDRMPFAVAIFIFLASWAVLIVVFGLLPFFLNMGIVKRWVNAARPVYSCEPLKSLDEGLAIFRPAAPGVDVKLLKAKVDELEGKLERLRRANHQSGDNRLNSDDTPQRLGKTAREAHGYTHSFHTRVKWERLYDYQDLLEETSLSMLSNLEGFADGFKGLVHVEQQSQSDYYCSWKFASFQRLEAWLASSHYHRFMEALQPMLEPTAIPEDDEPPMTRLVDGISDVFVNAPEAAAPSRPPPIWKNNLLISFSLTTVIVPSTLFIVPFWVVRVGVKNRFLLAFIMVHINTFINVFAAAPFWGWVFGSWLNAPRDPKKIKSAMWRIVDNGFTTQTGRLVFILFGFAVILTLGFSLKPLS